MSAHSVAKKLANLFGSLAVNPCCMGYVDAQQGAQARTAFRSAEKHYKRYKQPSTQLRNSKSQLPVPPTDLSSVLDFSIYAQLLKDTNSKAHGVSLATGGPFDRPVFVIDGHPGFYFIHQALSSEEQFCWIKESLTSFPQPPNRTNHNALYGPISNLWSNAQEQSVLVETTVNDEKTSQSSPSQQRGSELQVGGTADRCSGELSKDFSSLELSKSKDYSLPEHLNCKDGLQIPGDDSLVPPTADNKASTPRLVNEKVEEASECWHFVDTAAARNSSKETKPSKVISARSLLRKLRWATIGLQFDWSKKAYNTTLSHKELSPELSELAARLARPAMNGEKFKAEAAIVNYYGPDDMLGGHVDDMEADWGKPIVSISLGCKAVFLLGGKTRDESPVAMFVRSGDVVLMAGPARRCFHGVPRIFIDCGDAELPDFSKMDPGSAAPFMDYLRESRININVRQVY